MLSGGTFSESRVLPPDMTAAISPEFVMQLNNVFMIVSDKQGNLLKKQVRQSAAKRKKAFIYFLSRRKTFDFTLRRGQYALKSIGINLFFFFDRVWMRSSPPRRLSRAPEPEEVALSTR